MGIPLCVYLYCGAVACRKVRALVRRYGDAGDVFQFADMWAGSGLDKPPGEAIGRKLADYGADPVEQPSKL
jgi:hypothetical protein